MGKVIQFPPERANHNRHWNQGYADGYENQSCKVDQPEAYYKGYTTGMEDLIEDKEALASGDLDNLTEAEREIIYGDEKDRI